MRRHGSWIRYSTLSHPVFILLLMVFLIAGSMIEKATTIHGYEAVAITFPGFAEALAQLGGKISIEE